MKRPAFLKGASGHYCYDHNVAQGRERKKGAKTLREVSTVKESDELKVLLAKRLEDMNEEGVRLRDR